MENVFHFKQFDIAQDRCAMKIGTDGVLLGALSTLSLNSQLSTLSLNSKHSTLNLLDIGTGTGLVALMAAQQLNDAGVTDFHIDAVEIDPDAAQQAQENCEASPWGDKIEVHAMALQAFCHTPGLEQGCRKYDLILTNPPFYNATLKPEDEARAIARHKDSLPVREIMQCASQLLTDHGRLMLIHPMDYDTEIMTEAVMAGLRPVHLWNILTKTGKPCKRRISTFALPQGASPLVAETLAIRDEKNEYTDEYRRLTNAFYVSLK